MTQLTCSGVGKFPLSKHKRGFAVTSICECDALDQITAHVILDCLFYRTPRGFNRLLVLHDETMFWLCNI